MKSLSIVKKLKKINKIGGLAVDKKLSSDDSELSSAETSKSESEQSSSIHTESIQSSQKSEVEDQKVILSEQDLDSEERITYQRMPDII